MPYLITRFSKGRGCAVERARLHLCQECYLDFRADHWAITHEWIATSPERCAQCQCALGPDVKASAS